MAAVNKRYYWLKLPKGFFGQKEIKRLRKVAGGDTYTIIYLKMLLKSLSSNGVLYFDGVEDDFIAELALDIDEDEENVAITVQYLTKQNILVALSEEEFLLTTCAEMVGSETNKAALMRQSRAKKKLLLETQNSNNVTQALPDVTKRYTEKEKEIEIEIETDIEKEGEPEGNKPPPEVKKIDYQQIADMYNDTCVSFPRLMSLSEKRKKAIKARLKQYTIEDFKTLFTKAEASNFLKGANERDWSANFDWLIMDSNMAKVLSGNYDNKPKKPAAPTRSAAAYNSYPQRQYDYDAMENMLLKQQNPPDTAGNNAEIKARAEALRQQLQG